jgi:hypothetical protein
MDLRLSHADAPASRTSMAGWVLAPIKSLDLGEWLVTGIKKGALSEGL